MDDIDLTFDIDVPEELNILIKEHLMGVKLKNKDNGKWAYWIKKETI